MTTVVVRRIRGRLLTYRRQGLRRSARIELDQAVLGLLRPIFGFDRWHSRSPNSARPYREGVADLVTSLNPECVVEVGCGLGSILSRVGARRRIGYDVDTGAIKAARFLRGRSIQFVEGGFEQVADPHIDVLIAVNWIHAFTPEQLKTWIEPLLSRTHYLLVDSLDPASPLRYDHYHDFAFLEGKAKLVRTDSFGEEHRQFILYRIDR